MKITKEHVEQAIGYCLREKNDDFIIPLFESLTLDEVKDLFTYYDTDSNVSIGKLKTADELINKELLRLEKNELLEWNPHVYGEGWHLTELGGDVVKVLLEVYYNSYLKNEIDKNDFLKSCVTNIFQNHGSISLYLKSEFINGYIQINRETREVVSTEIPAAHSTRDLNKLIDRLIRLRDFINKLQDELNSLELKSFIDCYLENL